MKKFNKDTIIEIIGAIILLALISGIVSCNIVCPYDPNNPREPIFNDYPSQAQM
ncbi:MAG: hypothetical protein K2N06_00250 [Oscillospiraceae bacterium]|nr:hypothetical protein [Oscillospiraceae bacterium]